MSKTAAHFSSLTPAEQEPNGVQTEFDPQQMFDLLQNAIQSWVERTRLDAVLLEALVQLSAKNPTLATEGFTPQDVAEQMRLVKGRAWAIGDTNEIIADKVRRYWNLLTEKLWPQKAEGITQLVLDRGLSRVPELDRIEGGGTGRPTRYRIKFVPIAPPQIEEAGHQHSAFTGNEIRYICEDLSDAGFMARLFSKGYQITGWRRLALLGVYAAALLIIAIAVLLLIAVLIDRPMRQNIFYVLFEYAIIWSAFWLSIGSVLALPNTRIATAPWWIQLGEDDRLIEWRCPPRYPSKVIKIGRYTAVCPICSGKVIVKGGGLKFWGRLIGRCQESPREHVFSFDHILRTGRELR